MYLQNVLNDIQKESAPPKSLDAEHLYKLNEAVFNLPEEDHIDPKMSAKLFQALQKIRLAYNAGKICDSDQNFFYDYIALLGTMQNQHFFSAKQTEKMLAWVHEAIGGSVAEAAPAQPAKADTKKLQKLQQENQSLKEEYEKMTVISSAVEVIKGFKPLHPESEDKAKSKAKSKAKADRPKKAESKKTEDEEAVESSSEKKKGKEPKAKAKPKAKEAPKKWKLKEATAEPAAA